MLLLHLPHEILLRIFEYLDLPELHNMHRVAPILGQLSADGVLHHTRLYVTTPSRVDHGLFGAGKHGLLFRPTLGDLVQRHILRGLGLERRIRLGLPLFDLRSVKQYEIAVRLHRALVERVVSGSLRRRSSNTEGAIFATLHLSGVLPDKEYSQIAIARKLLPIMRALKWSFRRDELAKRIRDGRMCNMNPSSSMDPNESFSRWLEDRGKGIVQDGERVRLATCPNIKTRIEFYESLRV